MNENSNKYDTRGPITKAFFMDLKTKTGIEYGKVVHFGKMLRYPHHSADWRFYKWMEIMRIPQSIQLKNDYLCGGMLFEDDIEYLKERGVKIPEPDGYS